MKSTQISAIALVFTSLFASQAMASEVQTLQGAYEVVTESGRFAKDVFSSNYPAPQTESLTREQVRIELAQAIEQGNVMVTESGQRANEAFSANYATQDKAGLSREDVRAELAIAIENGLLDQHISF
ncbi:MAG: DUF4148 domain-containing protein [Alcaligenaceae bacterium]|nr:DUF4148 domain-containing protein [Alcaligenaceae bacterium]